MTDAPRSQVESFLTGLSDEIVSDLIEERVAHAKIFGHDDVIMDMTPQTAKTIRPPMSLFTAIVSRAPQLMVELERGENFCNATLKLCSSLAQYALRQQVGVASIEIREPRFAFDDTGPRTHSGSFRAALFVERALAQDFVPIGKADDATMWDVVCKHNRRMASVADCRGIFRAIEVLVSSMRAYAERRDVDPSRIKIAEGSFLPTADGGELRLFFETVRLTKRALRVRSSREVA